MPYIENICKAGKTIEIERYYSSRFNKKGIVRGKNNKKTKEEQKEVNRRQAEKKLRRNMNANFGPGDYHLVLDYQKEHRPDGKKEMKKQIEKFLRDMRNAYKKAGKVFKYIHVMEIGTKGARHHHLVITAIDPKLITKNWPYGRVHIDPLDDTGQYKKLAAYLIKYSDTWMGTEHELQKRRWNQSRNMTKPAIKKRIIKERNGFREEAKEKKGYYVDKETIRSGIHDKTGYTYFAYTLVKIERQESRVRKRGEPKERLREGGIEDA